MKVAILICAMAAAVTAAPRYDRTSKLDAKLSEHVRLAEQAWAAAARETDAQKQTALWEQAAAAFAAVDADPLDPKIKREAAYAAVLAWKNALVVDVKVAPGNEPTSASFDRPVPQPVPAREAGFVAAIDRYVKYITDPGDAELPGLLFLKARTYARYNQLDTAIPIYRAILDRHRQHEVAVYSASLLLDAYNRLEHYDLLVALAAELAKDDKLMRANADLAQIVRRIQSQGKRKQAEDLEKRAKASRDWDLYTQAGAAYLAIYNADPRSKEGDEVLYNAGVAYEEGRSFGVAMQAYEMMQKSYPSSRITARALARLGKLYGDLAMYDKAADKLEQYAKKYAGEKDAYDAMSDAIYYRKALGDRGKVIAGTKYFIKTFGAKKPAEAANAMWSLTSVYEGDPDSAIKHLREYLRSHRGRDAGGRAVIAHAKIGLMLWKQSCPHAGLDGLCVKSAERAPRTCGKGTTRAWTVTPRDQKKRAAALLEFVSAAKELERAHVTGDPAALYYYAQGKLAAADDELEANLALAFPSNLNFDPGNRANQQASLKRFNEWIEQRRKTGSSVSRKYEAVLAAKDAASSITAASRFGIITQGFASALVTAEIPRDVRTGPQAADKITAYCAAMAEAAQPLEEQAVQAYGTCLAKSTELSWFADSSAMCERELSRMTPEDYPLARELRAKPAFAAPLIAIEPLRPQDR